MTVAPRPPRRPGDERGLVNPYPIRYPDSTSPAVMTRRAWWLVVVNLLIPGSAQAAAGNRRLAKLGLGATLVMWVLAVLAVLVAVVWRPFFLTVVTNSLVLLIIQIALVAYAVLWIVLALDTLRLVRLIKTRPWARLAVPAAVVAVTLVVSGGAGYAAVLVGSARNALGSVFSSGGPAVAPTDGYYNILLLGVDSGAGRDSMRPDSISVASVNADTGQVTITGIPRDMKDVPFAPGPMQTLFPDGYKGKNCGTAHCAINEIFTEVNVLRKGTDIYPDATTYQYSPGIEAVKDAAEGVTGLTIPYYVFIDMDGFAALIDALGGIDITVTERLPKGWGPTYTNEPASKWAIGWIEPGAQHMDGDTAQWYARSRYTTSDWDRMLRQRQLQEAILAQFTPANVLSRFQDVANAGTHIIETDIPDSMIGYFLDLAIKAKGQPVQSLELTPAGANIDPDKPDFTVTRALVAEKLHPSSATPSPTG